MKLSDSLAREVAALLKRLTDRLEKLEADHEKMRRALRWYRDKTTWATRYDHDESSAPIAEDSGQRAGDVLEGLEVK